MSARPLIVLAALMVALTGGTIIWTAPAAQALCTPGEPCPPPSGGGGGDVPDLSDGTKQARYQTPAQSCSVYANGGGMGMSCVSIGGGESKTLRERYGDQKLQRCRYSDIPPAIQTPFNPRPSEGRYMLMTCLENIDFDTYSGGRERQLALSIVFVPNGTDIADRDNPITTFLWNQFGDSEQMPIPFMRTRPNTTPIVGVPTYFTFRWLDPLTKQVVADGPYSGQADGAPFRRIQTRQGVVMEARATSITIDPNQQGIPPVTCDPSTPYREGASPKNQPKNACAITFPRSSASARKLATKPIPDNIKDAFYADITVSWQVTYGNGTDDMRNLGNGFTMRIRQVVPVQEVQAPNQPPAVIY
ncbi:MAG: hypothetical protein ABWY58_02160 [Aeromicrobium sp.]